MNTFSLNDVTKHSVSRLKSDIAQKNAHILLNICLGQENEHIFSYIFNAKL